MTYATLGVFYLRMNFEILLFVAGCVSMRYYITFNVEKDHQSFKFQKNWFTLKNDYHNLPFDDVKVHE